MTNNRKSTAAMQAGKTAVVVQSGQTALLAVCAGLIVLPLYSTQPLAGVIGPSFGLDFGAAGTFSMLSLVGYALGLLLLVPLTDVIENRRLLCCTLSCGCIVLAFGSIADRPIAFGVTILCAGACCSGIQILVPLAAQSVPEANRGQTIGKVMSGLMLGILCSRPLASIVAEHFGWRAVYGLYAVIFGLMTLLLRTCLMHRIPDSGMPYLRLLGSMWRLLIDEPMLRRRALSQALCMVAFSLFWGVVALRLAQPPFYLHGDGIALFALAGAAGVIIAPIAGRIGDNGYTFLGTRAAHLAIAVAAILGAASAGDNNWARLHPSIALSVLAISAFVLDLGVIGDQTLGRRLVNLLNPAARGRLNGLFTGLFFIGGACGSALAGPLYARFGWNGICTGCALTALLGLASNGDRVHNGKN